MQTRLELDDKQIPAAAAAAPWIGLDVAKRTFAAALYIEPQPGAVRLRRLPVAEFSRAADGVAALSAWVEELLAARRPEAPAPRVCLEATGDYSRELAEEILRQRPAWQPAIVNPRLVREHAQSLGRRGRSDRADARTTALYGAERQPAPWQSPAPAYRTLQELCREREALVKSRSALRNRMEKQTVTPLIAAQQRQLDAMFERQIEALDAAIATTIAQLPQLRADADVFKQLPGVGDIVAAETLGELGDLRRYKSQRALAAMVGLNPQRETSGTSVDHNRGLSKIGNGRVRRVLYLAAMAALRTREDHGLKRLYRRLVEAGKKKKQALGALMRKILLLMRTLLLSGQPYDPARD